MATVRRVAIASWVSGATMTCPMTSPFSAAPPPTRSFFPGRPGLAVAATAAPGGGEGMNTNRAPPYADYEEFRASLEALRGDPLEKEGGRIVVARGNPRAKLMVIGEAPGAQEDEQGLPFVGRSGQLLDKILQAVDFNVDEDLYVCNLVRRRPPENRNPLAKEVAFYETFLQEEVRLIDPEIIVTTGKYSTQAVLAGEKRGITQLRGSWYRRPYGGRERDVRPIFHPSYLLRNQSKEEGKPRWLTWQDAKAIRQRYLERMGGP